MANDKQKPFEYFVPYEQLQNKTKVNDGESLAEVSKFIEKVMDEKRAKK